MQTLDTGAPLSSNDPATLPQLHRKQGVMEETRDTLTTEERLIALGGAIKAVNGNEIGGYLAEWGTGDVRDLDHERFVADTDFALDWYSERPLLFHHGLDAGVGTQKIGVIKSLTPDDKGLWMQAILDERNEYVEYVKKLIDMGALGLSSASLPHLVRIEQDGTIKRWTLIEGSLTHTPADPRTTVMSLKSFMQATETEAVESEGQRGADAPAIETATETVAVASDEPPIESITPEHGEINMSAEQLFAMLASVGIELTPEQQAMLQEQLGGEMEAMASLPADQLQGKAEEIAGKAWDLLQEKQREAEAVTAAGAKALRGRMAASNAEPQSRASNRSNGNGRITDVHDLKYHHLSARDLVFGANLLMTAKKAGVSDNGVSAEFLRATADKVEKAAEYANGGYGDGYAVKAAIKADEVFSSNLTNNGSYFVGVAYDTQLWEAVREAPIYRSLIAKGIMEVDVPQGYNSIYIPAEGTDPTFYALAELNDETSDERLPVTAKSSNVTAARQLLTPKFIGARVSFTDIMEEDSLIPVLPFLRQKMDSRGQEVIEYVMINGDTETSTTNINYDGSAVSALADAKGRNRVFTAFDGFLKLPLVTTTAQSADGGALSHEDYLTALQLLPDAQQVDYARLAYIVDPRTHTSSLKLATRLTDDVRNGGGTVTNGQLAQMWGIDLFRSGQMALADADGKITYNGNVVSRGRILLVRADQWAIGYKRQMRTEVARDIDAQATVVVTTMRFGMTYRSATGSATCVYNLVV